MSVRDAALPEDALLQAYARRADCYTDCFAAPAPGDVDLATYLQAFYTTPLFRAERLVLRLMGLGGTDAQIAGLTQVGAPFAAWNVEALAPDQILLSDKRGQTRSWLRTTDQTLWFGSAVVPAQPGQGLGRVMRSLIGPHRLYSRALLASAERRLG